MLLKGAPGGLLVTRKENSALGKVEYVKIKMHFFPTIFTPYDRKNVPFQDKFVSIQSVKKMLETPCMDNTVLIIFIHSLIS